MLMEASTEDDDDSLSLPIIIVDSVKLTHSKIF